MGRNLGANTQAAIEADARKPRYLVRIALTSQINATTGSPLTYDSVNYSHLGVSVNRKSEGRHRKTLSVSADISDLAFVPELLDLTAARGGGWVEVDIYYEMPTLTALDVDPYFRGPVQQIEIDNTSGRALIKCETPRIKVPTRRWNPAGQVTHYSEPGTITINRNTVSIRYGLP